MSARSKRDARRWRRRFQRLFLIVVLWSFPLPLAWRNATERPYQMELIDAGFGAMLLALIITIFDQQESRL